MPLLITQELKFSLLKLSQVIKCFSFHVSCRGDHIPTPYSYIVNDGFPSKFRILDRTLYGVAFVSDTYFQVLNAPCRPAHDADMREFMTKSINQTHTPSLHMDYTCTSHYNKIA